MIPFVRRVCFCCLAVSLSLPALAADASVANTVEGLWKATWERFYLSRTNQFYDYLTSYEADQGLAHLPTAAEVKRQYPNECGYDTGMEDGMISAGVMLSLIVDRYAVTQEEFLRDRALDVYRGIHRSATAHGVPGFIARAVCPEDLTSIYPNSSRDQYTHAVHGLWLYAQSPLCNAETREEIGVLLSAVADRMTRNVTPENNYDSLRADGSRDTRGISRMWEVNAHEAARLPMIYAAAWDVTKNPVYYERYRHYIAPAVAQSATIGGGHPTYALLQMQASLELLLSLEKDSALQEEMEQTLEKVSAQCAERAIAADKRAKDLDLTRLCTDWRTEEGLSSEGHYRTIWYCIRESGEAALGQLMVAHQPFPEAQQALLEQAITRLDPTRVSSCGIFYLQAAYWKSLRRAAT